MPVFNIEQESQLESCLNNHKESLTVVHFHATWAPQCSQMSLVMNQLSKKHGYVQFLQLEAEAFPETSEKFEISSVPTFLFFKKAVLVKRLHGANAAELCKLVEELSQNTLKKDIHPAKHLGDEEPKDLNQRIAVLLQSNVCMIFMKGSPDFPKCGFSRQLIEILNQKSIDYATFDILEDEEIRQGLKVYSDWPTYPQIYLRGELIGGLDILKDLLLTDEDLVDFPKKISTQNRLKALIHSASVMLFMKGNPVEPKCGFSRQIVDILHKADLKFSTFDILEDETVRQGLKVYSDWPTFPQLYIRGEFIGGLDIVKEMYENGELSVL